MTETSATAIPATLVKTLRDRTGAGIMACRTTLAETGGDLDAAIERLRDAQTTMAAKKADRVALEGLVAIETSGASAVRSSRSIARRTSWRAATTSAARCRRSAPIALATGGHLAALAARAVTGRRRPCGRSRDPAVGADG